MNATRSVSQSGANAADKKKDASRRISLVAGPARRLVDDPPDLWAPHVGAIGPRGWQARLYPTPDQVRRLNQGSGRCAFSRAGCWRAKNRLSGNRQVHLAQAVKACKGRNLFPSRPKQ